MALCRHRRRRCRRVRRGRAPSACQRSASAGARASPAHTKDTPATTGIARSISRFGVASDNTQSWTPGSEGSARPNTDGRSPSRSTSRTGGSIDRSDRGDHHGGATAALGGPTQRQHDDLDAIDDHRRKPDPRPYRRATRAPTPSPNCLLQTHRSAVWSRQFGGWGRYGARRRCPGTWWAPPPSKRLGQAIPVRRVRFPSTSASPSLVSPTCVAGAWAGGGGSARGRCSTSRTVP